MALAKQQRDAGGVPAVHRVFLGGTQEWRRLEASIVAQLVEAGATDGQVNRIAAQLKKVFLKWRPETVILINEDDRHTVLPVVEDLAHRERVTANGLIFEILQRELRDLLAGEGR